MAFRARLIKEVKKTTKTGSYLMSPEVVKLVGKVDPETEFEEQMREAPPAFDLAKQWPFVLAYSLVAGAIMFGIAQSDKIIALFSTAPH